MKSDILDHNTIVETKDAEFFENIFPLKDGHIPKKLEILIFKMKMILLRIYGEVKDKEKKSHLEMIFTLI